MNCMHNLRKAKKKKTKAAPINVVSSTVDVKTNAKIIYPVVSCCYLFLFSTDIYWMKKEKAEAIHTA